MRSGGHCPLTDNEFERLRERERPDANLWWDWREGRRPVEGRRRGLIEDFRTRALGDFLG